MTFSPTTGIPNKKVTGAMRYIMMLSLVAMIAAAPARASGTQAGEPSVPPEVWTPPSMEVSDPLEPWNRGVFYFNVMFAKYVFQPTAYALGAIVPVAVQDMLGNAYHNLAEPEKVASDFIAGDLTAAQNSTARIAINSTVGLVGLLDVAKDMGYEPSDRWFGQALCEGGLPPGTYLVLPFVGGTTLNDATAAGVLIVGSYYLLEMWSPAVALASLLLDLSASAASLKNAGNVPLGNMDTAYEQQRAEYLMSRGTSCSMPMFKA